MPSSPPLAADAPLGRLLRLPLKLIPDGARVPILTTRARGMRWIAGSGPHGCWLGTNEAWKRRLFQHEVRPGMVVWDVGANVGSWTMLASACAGRDGAVIALEPVPANLRHLRAHIDINDLRNVRVVPVAVTERAGEVTFEEHPDRLQGRVSGAGTLRVDAVTLDGLAERGDIPLPDFIKMDIEGGEGAALRGARRVLSTQRPIVFVATHGETVRAECIALLESLAYDTAEIGRARDELVARPKR